jgi:hypothetical protein
MSSPGDRARELRCVHRVHGHDSLIATHSTKMVRNRQHQPGCDGTTESRYSGAEQEPRRRRHRKSRGVTAAASPCATGRRPTPTGRRRTGGRAPGRLRGFPRGRGASHQAAASRGLVWLAPGAPAWFRSGAVLGPLGVLVSRCVRAAPAFSGHRLERHVREPPCQPLPEERRRHSVASACSAPGQRGSPGSSGRPRPPRSSAGLCCQRGPCGIRTHDTRIKSPLLCR